MTRNLAAELDRDEWLTGLEDTPVALAVNPSRVALAGAGGSVAVLDLATGSVLDAAEVSGGLLDCAWSPDGERLALCGPLGHGTWIPGRTPDWRATGRWSARARWSPGGALAVADGARVLVEPADGGPPWRSPRRASTVTDLAWLDRGRRVVTTAYGGLEVYRPGHDEPVARYTYPGSHLAVAVPAGERWLVTGNQDATVHVFRRVPRRDDGDELHMRGYPEKVSLVAFDSGGRWLAVDGSAEVTVWDFSHRGPAGTAPRVVTGHTGVRALAWAPGRGAVLASGGLDGGIGLHHPQLLQAGMPRGVRRWLAPPGPVPVAALAWAGEARLVAAWDDGTVRQLNVVRS